MDAERLWWEAATAVEVELETEVVEEAYEVHVAEVARARLADRVGPARLRLRSGVFVEGDVVADEAIEGHLRVQLASGEVAVVPLAGLIALRGTRPRLRREDVRDGSGTLSSWLRRCRLAGLRMRACTVDGLSWSGTLSTVGADHVGLVDESGECWLICITSVECWVAPHAAT
jgi:hypothetical protein